MNSSDIVVRLRHALARGVADAHGGDWPGLAGGGAHAAAVLVPLVRREEEPTVLLTRRTSHLRHHAGQIGFPGGGVEAGDDCAEATALRETREEIGLSSERIELIGRLPDYLTGTGFRITPVVGLLRPPLDLAALVIDTFEVAEVFEVPLAFFLDPANHRQ
ncbi:MAG: CoA pyrophosphatase, partial [Azoarcus sp.]|nr:CoA pyrophosphatase [Azoarcus sp.]